MFNHIKALTPFLPTSTKLHQNQPETPSHKMEKNFLVGPILYDLALQCSRSV